MDADLSLLAGNVSTSSALTSASRLSSCADFSTTTSAPSTSTAGRQHRAQTSSLATAIEDGKKENVFVCVRFALLLDHHQLAWSWRAERQRIHTE